MPTAATTGSAPTPTAETAALQLVEHGAYSASGVGAKTLLAAEYAHLVFELIVTAVAGVPGDTLAVFVQQSWDGVNYDDVAAFALLSGAAPPQVRQASFPARRPDAAPELHTQTDAALPAASLRDVPLARQFRAKWSVAGGGGSVWTFQVVAVPRASR